MKKKFYEARREEKSKSPIMSDKEMESRIGLPAIGYATMVIFNDDGSETVETVALWDTAAVLRIRSESEE